jgi:hypothetical protein
MNEVYAHTKIARKEQLTICLRHMGGGPNDFRLQPRQQFVVAEGKSNAEPWQYSGDQFQALEDQLETSPTQIFDFCRPNGNESENPSAEH